MIARSLFQRGTRALLPKRALTTARAWRPMQRLASYASQAPAPITLQKDEASGSGENSPIDQDHSGSVSSNIEGSAEDAEEPVDVQATAEEASSLTPRQVRSSLLSPCMFVLELTVISFSLCRSFLP